MSARPGEWHVLGHDSDPVPGDPMVVSRLARDASATADEIARLSGQLGRLAELTGWTGKAAEQFAAAAEDCAEDLGKAHQRYAELGDAVQSWEWPLELARDESADALRLAVEASAEMSATAGDTLSGVAKPTPEQEQAQKRRAAAHDAAADQLAAARSKLDSALNALDEAGRRTADKIRDAASHWDDGFWDNAKGAIRSIAGALKFVVDVLGYVTMAIAAIALIAAFIVTLPASLMVLAAVLTAAMLIGHTLLVVSESGKASWLDVGMDIVALATFGLGKFAAPVARSVASARAATAVHAGGRAAASRAATEALTVTHRLASAVSRSRLPLGPLRGLAKFRLDLGAARANAAGQAAERAVHAGRVTAPQGPLSVVRAGTDRALAVQRAEIARLLQLDPPPAVVQQLERALRPLLPLEVNAGVNVAAGAADAIDQTGLFEWKEPVVDAVERWRWRLTRGER